MTPTFWSGKRVFLTGHTGFKGSWLALWLQHMGAEVTGYSLAPPTTPSLFEIANVANEMHSLHGDIRDGAQLLAAIAQARPHVIFHLAAQSLVRRSYIDPVETYSTNVMGTVNVLEAARQTDSVRAIVNVTSDKCYENHEWPWGYREIDPIGGHDPYSNSKGCAELITAAYRNSFFSSETPVGLATARAGNVIGGGDWAIDRLLPDLIKAVAGGDSVHIRNPHSIRPWQHVLEPLSGYLTLAEKLLDDAAGFAEAWNFGPSEDSIATVQKVLELFQSSWGTSAAWVADHAHHLHEAQMLRLDSTKAHTKLGWMPRWDLQTAIGETVRWHKAHQANADMHALCIEQIDTFMTTKNEH